MIIKYLIAIMFTGALSSCTLTSTSPSEQGPKQAVGTITGMVIGGKIADDLKTLDLVLEILLGVDKFFI